MPYPARRPSRVSPLGRSGERPRKGSVSPTLRGAAPLCPGPGACGRPSGVASGRRGPRCSRARVPGSAPPCPARARYGPPGRHVLGYHLRSTRDALVERLFGHWEVPLVCHLGVEVLASKGGRRGLIPVSASTQCGAWSSARRLGCTGNRTVRKLEGSPCPLRSARGGPFPRRDERRATAHPEAAPPAARRLAKRL